MNVPYFNWLLVGCCLAVVSCGNTVVPMTQPTQGELARAGEIHQAVNAYRRSQGLEPLQRHEALDGLARKHSEFLRVNRGKFKETVSPNLSHDGFGNRALYASRVCRIAAVAENVAYCPCDNGTTAGVLTKLWVNSPVHRKNMTGKWAVTGLGIQIDDDGTVFATQIFGSAPNQPNQREFFNRLNQRY